MVKSGADSDVDDTSKAGPSIRRLDEAQNDGLDRALGDYPAQDNVSRAEAPAQRGQIFVKTVPPSAKRAELEDVSIFISRDRSS
jgi:hypothetical protein